LAPMEETNNMEFFWCGSQTWCFLLWWCCLRNWVLSWSNYYFEWKHILRNLGILLSVRNWVVERKWYQRSCL
jgi:hypothetical protein